MIDLRPSDEQQLVQKTARDVAAGAIAPLAQRIDRGDGHADHDELRVVYRAAREAGFTTMLLPQEHGGGGASCVDLCLVQEELGSADAGIAASLNLSMTVPDLLVAAGTEDQRAEWLGELVAADTFVLAGALNEPGVAGSDLFAPPDPSLGIRTRAERDGDTYTINGTKAGWVTNAGLADAYLVFARTDPTVPAIEGTTAFYVPAPSPGLSVGPRTEMLGMRSATHAEVFLDDVVVPADRRLGAEGAGLGLMATASSRMAVGLSAVFVGLARAALELAIEQATVRTSWGQPLRAHQAVALQLADAAVEVASARLLVWDAAAAVDHDDPLAGPLKVPAAKSAAVDTAIRAAETAVKVLGGAGVTKGMSAEKFLRDAWTGYSCDFTKEILRLGIAAQL